MAPPENSATQNEPSTAAAMESGPGLADLVPAEMRLYSLIGEVSNVMSFGFAASAVKDEVRLA